MHVHNSHVGLSRTAWGTSLAIGQFDGFHRGHTTLIEHARILAGQNTPNRQNPLGVLTFDPSPNRYFAADTPCAQLMNPNQRNTTANSLGVDHLFVLPFDSAMAERTPLEFVNNILKKAMQVRAVTVGADFRFGSNRQGDCNTLAELGKTLDFDVFVCPLVQHENLPVSSSRIRNCIARADMNMAATLLGRLWTVEGKVIRGRERGKTIGFPTANVDLKNYARPACGVYAVWAKPDTASRWKPAIANYGHAPTLGQRKTLLETHIFDFNDDLYGKNLNVAFCQYIRAEQSFASLDDLASQIHKDCSIARTILNSQSPPAILCNQ